MTKRDKALDDALDDLFAAARADPAPLPDHLFAAILADAAAQPGAEVAHSKKPVPRQRSDQLRGVWGQLWQAVGGMPAVAGLATACAVGLWIGLAPPAFLPDPAQLVGYEETTGAVPFDSYDLAVILTEDMQ